MTHAEKPRNWIAAQTSVAAIGVLVSIGIATWSRSTAPPTQTQPQIDAITNELATIRHRLNHLESTPERIPIFRPGRR